MSDSDSSAISFPELYYLNDNSDASHVQHYDPPDSPDVLGIRGYLDDIIRYSLTSDDSDVELNNDSDESDNASQKSSLCLPQTSSNNSQSVRTHQFWSIPKELYNREIGNYKNCAKWNNKFYQSEVAIKKLKLSKQLKGHHKGVNSLNFNKTGDLITSGSNDFNIRLWDWSKGKCLIKHNGAHNSNILQTKFLPTQSEIHIVSSGGDGLVILSGLNNCDVIFSKIIARHSLSCYKIAVHDDLPNLILSCGEDGIVKNIDIR